MRREQLEHIIRAACGITGAPAVVIVGSQAILGQFPDAPEELRVSIEADVFTLRDPADADLIDGSIGERSTFHETFGYYAHGVGRETAVLPHGWEDRLIRLENANTGGGAGLCLEVHDLAVSKLIAGRDKDREFIHALLRRRLAERGVLAERLTQTELPADLRALCEGRLKALE